MWRYITEEEKRQLPKWVYLIIPALLIIGLIVWWAIDFAALWPQLKEEIAQQREQDIQDWLDSLPSGVLPPSYKP
ncbi:MAG: hypothetical protein ACOX17_07465 [Christensenellales bacterium]